MSVLFLDIDGVVLSGEELWASQNNRYLPPHKVAMVKEVCDRSGAVVVVSSTWRFSESTESDLRNAGLCLHRDWRTPMSGRIGSIFVGRCRGEEIAAWLADHPEVESWAIVDDDSDMLAAQFDRFVRTPFVTGIDRSHVDRLVSILNTPLIAAV